jgi:hypothetical protein
MQIKKLDIVRYAEELNSLSWTHQNLVFIDEVSFDNRGMLRRYGYARVGERLVVDGEYGRKARVSLLCFVGVDGLLAVFDTVGTFDREKFVNCLRSFALSGGVHEYPSQNSVWVMDGARIHCHENIPNYLRSAFDLLLSVC